MHRGIFVHDIFWHVAPKCLGVKLRKPSKSQKYPPKLPSLTEGMTCLVDIIPALIRLKIEDHDLLLLRDVRDEPYDSIPMGPGAPIRRIPQTWASGLDQYGLLGLINMPHFG